MIWVNFKNRSENFNILLWCNVSDTLSKNGKWDRHSDKFFTVVPLLFYPLLNFESFDRSVETFVKVFAVN